MHLINVQFFLSTLFFNLGLLPCIGNLYTSDALKLFFKAPQVVNLRQFPLEMRNKQKQSEIH